MSQKSVAKLSAKPSPEPAAKIIVFGVDNVDWSLRAGWFPTSQADAAHAVAKQFHLNVVEVTNGIAADLGAAIPEGRIHMKGPGAVPTVRDDLYKKFVAAINPTDKPGLHPAEPNSPAYLSAWDALKPGSIVLATESVRDGWYEAIVVERTGDKVTIQWRDYAGHPHVTIRVTDVALLNPTRS